MHSPFKMNYAYRNPTITFLSSIDFQLLLIAYLSNVLTFDFVSASKPENRD